MSADAAMRRWGVGLAMALVVALATLARAAPCPVTIDLAAEETAGGHTIAQHVGKTATELWFRLAQEPRIPAASSFRSLEDAQRFVGEALCAKEQVIRRWLGIARPGERFRVYYRAESVVGYGVLRSTREFQPMNRVVAVLKRTERADKPYMVLTAYPEP